MKIVHSKSLGPPGEYNGKITTKLIKDFFNIYGINIELQDVFMESIENFIDGHRVDDNKYTHQLVMSIVKSYLPLSKLFVSEIIEKLTPAFERLAIYSTTTEFVDDDQRKHAIGCTCNFILDFAQISDIAISHEESEKNTNTEKVIHPKSGNTPAA